MLRKEHCYGSCIFEDSTHKPREFTIDIDSCVQIKSIISTIAHEITHVAQFARGEYKMFKRNFTHDCPVQRWKTKLVNTDVVGYDDLPWEKHAYKMEEKLSKKYFVTNYWKKRRFLFKTLSGRKPL